MVLFKKAFYAFLIISFVNLEITSAFPLLEEGKHKATIAVLNFQSNTGDSEIDAMLSTGTPETIITDLSNIKEIQVVERTRIKDIMDEIHLSFSGLIDDVNIQKAGKLLGAQYILFGNWQRFGAQFRVNARLVEVESSSIIVGIKETGSENKIFDIQDNISEEILSKLEIKLSTYQKAKLRKRETVSIDAFKKFSQGLIELDKGNRNSMVSYMKKAIEIDPNYQKPKEYLYVNIDPESGSQSRYGMGFDYLLGERQAKSATGLRWKSALVGFLAGFIIFGGTTALLEKEEKNMALPTGLAAGIGMAFIAFFSTKPQKREKKK